MSLAFGFVLVRARRAQVRRANSCSPSRRRASGGCAGARWARRSPVAIRRRPQQHLHRRLRSATLQLGSPLRAQNRLPYTRGPQPGELGGAQDAAGGGEGRNTERTKTCHLATSTRRAGTDLQRTARVLKGPRRNQSREPRPASERLVPSCCSNTAQLPAEPPKADSGPGAGVPTGTFRAAASDCGAETRGSDQPTTPTRLHITASSHEGRIGKNARRREVAPRVLQGAGTGGKRSPPRARSRPCIQAPPSKERLHRFLCPECLESDISWLQSPTGHSALHRRRHIEPVITQVLM